MPERYEGVDYDYAMTLENVITCYNNNKNYYYKIKMTK